ncbi:MAG: radical SAM protein [Thermodesulfobacteriota bacterium]
MDLTGNPVVLLLYCSPDLETITQRKSLFMPTGLFFLAARLHSLGIPVHVENFSTLSPEERRSRLLRINPGYVGLSMLTINRFSTLELATLVRATIPHARIILGGPHASALAPQILQRAAEVDCVVRGEGEETLSEVIGRYHEGAGLDEVKGIAFRRGERVLSNPARPWISDLSALPHPAALFAYEKVSTSRGCPFQCGFCSSSQFWGRGIRSHPAGWVVEEIELLYRKQGIREFSVNDDLFTLDKQRVLAICEGIVQKRLYVRFRCMSRVNTLCEERLSWLKRAGCGRIDFGVESGSERLLRAMGKRTNLDQVRKAFSMTRAAGIGTGCFLIVGFPGEDDRSIAETERLVTEIRPTFCDMSSMALFPDSPVFRKLVKEGAVAPDIWFRLREHTLFLTDGGGKEKYVRYLERLRSSYQRQQGSFALCTSELGDCLARFPGLGHAALDLADCLVEAGRAPASLEVLMEAAGKEPDNPFLWHRMGEIALLLGNPALAMETVRLALDLQPCNYESLLLAARAAESAGNADSALEFLDQAIRVRPEKIEGYLQKADMLAGHMRWSLAYESYASAVRIDPYWPPLRYAMRECEAHL